MQKLFLFTKPLKIFFSKTTQQNGHTNSPWVCVSEVCPTLSLNNSERQFEHSKFNAKLLLHTNSPWESVVKLCSNGDAIHYRQKIIAKDNV